MEWVGLAFSILGVIFSIVSLVQAYISHKQNEELKSLIVAEKDMIRDRILDMRQTLKSRRDQVFADREARGNPNIDAAIVRIEDIEGMMENLDRFADRLQKPK